MTECILQAENLSKHWGGLKALNEFNIKFYDKSLHSIVGPNGAGKSTMLNILCGTYPATKGVILYRGENITGLKSHQFCRKGIGRSFQKTNIFKDATCLENCCIAAQQRVGSSFNMFKSKHSSNHVTSIAKEALEQVGLMKQANTKARTISYGEQRQLEIAMVLATDPQVLLLDEPMAGMGHEESLVIVDLLKSLKQRYCIVLVEHDMDAVFELSDLMTVMVDGKHLITDVVDNIRANPLVQDAYLGNDDEVF
ncbi:ABC transporter ATP-binding protein [Alteromonas sp. KS69]|jgi:branched-chain amino acid transport system ATP-binding protein|uniref:ABC transporter ATP-binding protein n=1 Tax=Paraglaciecola chathamensis TaxID=368405 RepID=A0ABS0W915_9ALTE|nr:MULTISPECIES: ABC transporter ATP-binding protein [Alteromonadaceae]MBJ2135244.1 ABC transporter ATP-binding protein [Paraglaciecola chathamensis]MBO7921085.1 ABC transporter ATP-binding protein [Alteromonas sp. K632G]RUP82389.1 ABC transporter ATP-binding protein [Alteromonas sp. KS69]|tara:strand:+ start:19484 stop:20242 length:759 start_codon:yes stop_codon:yes gene_type:complete